MLVFTRKRGEALMVGDGIEIIVIRTGKEGVRIGVRAPTSVPVHRKEIYELIREENRAAAAALHHLGGEPDAGDSDASIVLPAGKSE